MNFFKKIIATLTTRENPFSSERSGDPRTDTWTRGLPKVESTEERFARKNREEAEIAEGTRQANLRRMGTRTRGEGNAEIKMKN